jgi:hypothetical protein
MMARLILVACAASGCAWVAKGQVNKYDRRVKTYERLAPDGEALGRGDIRSTSEIVSQMANWIAEIKQQSDIPQVERQKLIDRLELAVRRYLIAAAQLTDTPDLGYALAVRAVTYDDPDAIAVVRRLAEARGERRQQLFAETHTYAVVKRGETTMATTSSGASVVNGKVAGRHETREVVLKDGNCVFATRPFGAEGVRNPTLTFRLIGTQPIHVRCYLNRDLSTLPGREPELTVTVLGGGPKVGGHVQRIPFVSAPGMPAIDFVLDPIAFDDRKPFRAATVLLSYSYTLPDLVVVYDHGRQVLRKERGELELAGSPVFWDRDGTPSSASTSANAPVRATVGGPISPAGPGGPARHSPR